MIELERFGRRLREERERKSLNQEAFAALGGVKKNSQVIYEGGKTAPTVEYLYRLAGHGVDIGYVVTGVRSGENISDEQRWFFSAFRSLSTRERRAIKASISILSAMEPDPVQVLERIEMQAMKGAGSHIVLEHPDRNALLRIADDPASSKALRDRAEHLLGARYDPEQQGSLHEQRQGFRSEGGDGE